MIIWKHLDENKNFALLCVCLSRLSLEDSATGEIATIKTFTALTLGALFLRMQMYCFALTSVWFRSCEAKVQHSLKLALVKFVVVLLVAIFARTPRPIFTFLHIYRSNLIFATVLREKYGHTTGLSEEFAWNTMHFVYVFIVAGCENF